MPASSSKLAQTQSSVNSKAHCTTKATKDTTEAISFVSFVAFVVNLWR